MLTTTAEPDAHGDGGHCWTPPSSGRHRPLPGVDRVLVAGAALILVGAFGVILLRNPVHCALMLVVTLFGVAVVFVDQSADFLAAVQIIVYAGAIVILFLFVIMFLGVDRARAGGPKRPVSEAGRRPARPGRPRSWSDPGRVRWSIGPAWTTGRPVPTAVAGQLSGPGDNVQKLGQSIFTRYLLPFEMTAALLVIAVVAAVVLSRRQQRVASEMSRAEQEEIGR